jgi:hypothetical protein
MRTPMTAFLADDVPTPAVAGSALRFVYAATFLAQVVLAVVVGALLVGWGPRTERPHDMTAGVLLAMAVLHVPVGLVLAWAVSRAPGKGPALMGSITAAVVLAVPAWFAVLLAISAQRAPFVWAAWAVLALGYAGGMALSARWVRAALTPVEPEPATPASDGAGA